MFLLLMSFEGHMLSPCDSFHFSFLRTLKRRAWVASGGINRTVTLWLSVTERSEGTFTGAQRVMNSPGLAEHVLSTESTKMHGQGCDRGSA